MIAFAKSIRRNRGQMLLMNDNKGYRKFINARDEALERLLRNSRLRNTEMTNQAFRKVLEQIKLRYHRIMHTSSRMEMNHLEQSIEMIFDKLSFDMYMELISLRKKSYMLAYAGEAQAISQVVAKTAKIELSKSKLDAMAFKKLANGLDPMHSFRLMFNRIRRDIITALEYSFAHGEDEAVALGRVFMKFPKQEVLPKKKVLKTVKITEADKPGFSSYDENAEDSGFTFDVGREAPVHGFEWDQSTWDQVLDDVKSDYQAVDRSPETYVDMLNPYTDNPIRENVPEEDKYYAWEAERDITDDFVQQVRGGQVDSANKNGIDDFVWIAILDNKTDPCCEWRSGLLSSEIEQQLTSDHADDPCQATVPPAHFNCRCTLAPASDDLEAVDNSDTEREFGDWLNQR